MNTAQQIADETDADDGASLDNRCLASGAVFECTWDRWHKWRYQFDDGSALTGDCDGWGVEGATRFERAE